MNKTMGCRIALGLALGLVMLPSCVPDAEDRAPTAQGSGHLCGSMLSLTGTFDLGQKQPNDVFGCWPVGLWRFKATVEDSDCAEPPALLDEYAFRVKRNTVEGDDRENLDAYEYLSDPQNKRIWLSVSSGGGGLCQAGLMIFSEDGMKVWNLKPALEADRKLTGFGEYDEFSTSQW